MGKARFATFNANRYVRNRQPFEATALKPSEDLLVGMLRLIFRRIPIQSIQHSDFWISTSTHGEDVSNNAGQRSANQRDSAKTAVKPVQAWNRHPQEVVQLADGHTM